MLTNPSFALGLLNAYHAPNQKIWNKLASPIEHAEFVNAFLMIFSDNIYLSHDVEPSSPNRTIRDYCMFSQKKVKNAKSHLKLGDFQKMVNQNHCTSQNQLGEMMSNDTLRLWLKQLNLSAKDFCKMRK